MKKRKRLSPDEWAEIEAENKEVAQRLASRIAHMRAELDERRAAARRRPRPRRRLLRFL
jgi:hypothetical protein